MLIPGGGVPGFPGTLCGVNPGLAGFEEEDEMAAIDRYGIKEAAGFARNASAAADLVEDSIFSVN